MANHGQFTYMAHIYFKHPNQNFNPNQKFRPDCGGVLITWSHVLTAAHCIMREVKNGTVIINYVKKQEQRFEIHLGDHSSKKKDHNEEIRRVRQLVPHPLAWKNHFFTGGHWDNDIGVIILQRAVSRFNPYIKPLWFDSCFVKQKPQNGEDVTLTGWGRREHPRKNENGAKPTYKPDKLQVFETSIDVCGNFIQTNYTDQFVCAFEKGRDVGHCHGDSGGWYSFFNRK